jgi:O-antigen/teichoic acid export membrane protein
VAVTALAAVSGLLLARVLGPAGRGTYAIITSYTLAAATVGECGLTAAICYFVARDRTTARDVMRSGGLLLLGFGIVVGAVGVGVAPLLFDDPAEVAAFRVAFAAQPLVFVCSCWVFALQAVRITAWNVVRALQPAGYSAAIVLLAATGLLSVERAVLCLVGSVLLQALAAVALCRGTFPGRGRLRRRTCRDLLGYGGATLASAVPYLLNAHLDVLVLAVLVAPAQLGHYAVAVSLGMLPQPICAAFGNVAMPRLAARPDAAGSDHRAVVVRRSAAPPAVGQARRVALVAVAASLTTGVVAVAAISLLAPVVVPRLLGPAFTPSVGLFWLLAPGAALLGCNRAIDDVLRGLGRAMTVARCEGVGSVVTIVLLAALVPTIGIAGAPVASSLAYGVSFLLLLLAVLRAVDLPARTAGARLLWVATGARRRRAWITVPTESGRGNSA